MMRDTSALREPLLAARLLREEILAAPVPPAEAASLQAGMAALGGYPPASREAVAEAARLGATADRGVVSDFADVSDVALRQVAAAAGSSEWRLGPGIPFHGVAAPAPADVPVLYDELLRKLNTPAAVESWSPPVRAFSLHFLLLLVQPFAAPPHAVAHAAEALVLASDGFDARRMPTGRADEIGASRSRRPDADAFIVARAHALVDALGAARDLLRAATARALLRAWSHDVASGLNERQRCALDALAQAGRSLSLREYIAMWPPRRAPCLRTLQRDWRGLREGGWVEESSAGRFHLVTSPLEWEAVALRRS